MPSQVADFRQVTASPQVAESGQVTASPPVAVSSQVAASGQVAASCSCRSLAHPTVLWYHRHGHPLIPRLRSMASHSLTSGLQRVFPSLPPSLAPPFTPCVAGYLRATLHSSSLRPATAPFQTLHLDTTVFPLAKKSKVTSRLIWWLLATEGTRGSRVRCLHSDRGGKFCSGVLSGFCGEQGIRQSWTLPESPYQNGVAEYRIGLVMDIAHTSMIHARAPHFLWPYALRYAAHQLNLQPRVSRPKVSPTRLWTGSPGVGSAFRVWGCLAFVRDTSADKLSARAIPRVFLGFPVGSLDYSVYHPPLHQFLDSRDVWFDESVSYYTWYPYQGLPVPPPPLFLTPSPPLAPPPPVPPPPPGPAPSGVSHATPLPSVARKVASPSPQSSSQSPQQPSALPRQVTVDFGGVGAGGTAAGGPRSGGIRSRGVGAGGAGTGGASSGGTGAGGAGTAGASSGGAGAGGAGIGGANSGVAGAGGAGACGANSGGAGVGGTSAGGASFGGAGAGGAGVVGASTEETGAGGTPTAAPTAPPHHYDTRLQALRRLEREDRLSPFPLTLSLTTTVLLTLLSPVFSPLVTDPRASPSSVSALIAAVADFASIRHLDYAIRVVAAPPPRPLSVGVESALGCDVLENTLFELEFKLLPPLSAPCCFHLRETPTPRMYREAVSGEWASQWKEAMDSELASWRSTGTYVDAVPPPRANVVNDMWLFKVKRPSGSPHVFKVGYVARCFTQRDYELHSLDFSTAFLQGCLHEEIWLRRPPSFTDTFPPGTQWSLRRPVYSLRQSPREWHETLRSTLHDLGFRRSSADQSLFVRVGSTPFFIPGYVDDLVFATACRAAPAEVKSELQKRHTCTDLGELQRYLGLQISRERAARTITLTQSHMVQQVLRWFGYQFSTTEPTPLAVDHRLTGPFPDDPSESSGPYGELVGCLMYLMTCTRSNLAFPLNFLSRFVATRRHRPIHWIATERVAKYLVTTSGIWLVLGGTQPVMLTGHCDSSYADDVETQRLTQGYCFSLGAGAMSWRSI
ncbi:unnamed protein product [Closterium sp. NIES-54]